MFEGNYVNVSAERVNQIEEAAIFHVALLVMQRRHNRLITYVFLESG